MRAALLAVAVAAALVGCGKKGNPLPPLRFNPAPAEDLTVRQLGTEVELKLSYPVATMSGLPLDGLSRLEVWRAEIDTGGGVEEAEAPAEEADADALPDEAGAETEEPAEEGEAEEEEATQPQQVDEAPASADSETAPAAAEVAPSTYVPEIPEIRPALFSQLAALEADVGTDELVAATTGGQIQIRLPLPEETAGTERIHGYAVRTFSLDGLESPFSNIVSIRTAEAPPAPTGIQVLPYKDVVQVRWQLVEEPVARYAVYRRLADARQYGDAVSQPTNVQDFFNDFEPIYGQRYIYTVRALHPTIEGVESGISAEVEVDYQDTFVPAAPTNVEALPEGGRIRILWDASADDDTVGYRVYRRDAGQEPRLLNDEPATRLEYLDRGLTVGLEYEYHVTAVDDRDNESEPSEVVSVQAR